MESIPVHEYQNPFWGVSDWLLTISRTSATLAACSIDTVAITSCLFLTGRVLTLSISCQTVPERCVLIRSPSRHFELHSETALARKPVHSRRAATGAQNGLLQQAANIEKLTRNIIGPAGVQKGGYTLDQFPRPSGGVRRH